MLGTRPSDRSVIMTLVTTGDLVTRAAGEASAIPAFNVITLEHAEAILDGAQLAGRAVILQISQNAVRFHAGRVRPLALAVAALADAVPAAASLHLDHVEDGDLLRQA